MEETIEILSVPVRNVSMDEATDFVFSRIAEGRGGKGTPYRPGSTR